MTPRQAREAAKAATKSLSETSARSAYAEYHRVAERAEVDYPGMDPLDPSWSDDEMHAFWSALKIYRDERLPKEKDVLVITTTADSQQVWRCPWHKKPYTIALHPDGARATAKRLLEIDDTAQ